jgi:flagellar basal-body rod protein FlgC
MNLFNAMEISASGLSAQRTATQVISMNLANVNTTWTEEGGPYLRQQVILSSSPIPPKFSGILADRMNRELVGVKAEVRTDDTRNHEMIFDPTHPHADESGYVTLPNVNLLEEMVGLLSAVRSYEANVTAFNSAKSMVTKSLEIGNQ